MRRPVVESAVPQASVQDADESVGDLARADVFSAGKIMQALVRQGLPLDDDVPPGPLRGVIMRAISPDRERRYKGAAQLLDAIENAVSPPPTGKWETADERAVRLVPRLQAGYIEDPAAFEELQRWANEIDLTDYDAMGDFAWALSALPTVSVEQWWEDNPTTFGKIFQAFAWRLDGSFDFGQCDSLANFARRAFQATQDLKILTESICGLAQLGLYHNRWHVRDVAVAMLQALRDNDEALAALEGLREAGPRAAEWTVGDSAVRTLHPALRAGIAEFLAQHDDL